jgi:hypothetical protein
MFNALLVFGLLLSACGPSAAELTPTVNPDAIRTEAVSTFAFSLTQTAFAAPTMTSTLTPSPTSTVVLSTSLGTATKAAVSSCNRLVYVRDVTIPDNTQMTPGQTFTKTWQVQNAGGCAWAPGFKFSLVGGDAMGGQTLTLSQPVAAGATTELSVPMTAPTGKTGVVQGTWRMADDKGIFFGDSLTVVIVLGGSAAPTSTSAAPTSTTGAPTATEATATTGTP